MKNPGSTHRAGTTGLLLLIVIAVALTASGCLGPLTGKKQTGSSSPAPKSSTTSATSTGGGGRYSATFSVPEDPGTGTETYRVSVDAIYRDGPFTRIGFTVTCDKKTTAEECGPWKEFGGGTFDSYGGFYLVDPVGHKEYIRAEGDESRPFSAAAGHLDRGKSETGWSVFHATPPSARKLDVIVPGGGPVIKDVPVGKPRPETQTAPIGKFNKPKDTTDASGLEMKVLPLRLRSKSEGAEEQQDKDRTKVTLSSDVLFAFGKATLTAKAKTILQRQATRMDASATDAIQVTGYTDAKGSPKVNNPLSKNRAKAVADYLKSHAEHDFDYSVTGKGEADPVAANTKSDGSDNPKGRAKNRRVTVSYKSQPPKNSSSTSPSSTSSTQQPKQPRPVDWALGDDDNTNYRVSVQDVRRHGDLAFMRFKVKCTKTTSDSGCWSLWDLKDRTNSRAGGFRLYQRPTKTTYYPLIDSEDDELTTAIPSNIDQGIERDFWVSYPAPDAGVTAIDVTLPQGGPTVRDVPVT